MYIDEVWVLLSEVIGVFVDESIIVFLFFYINYGWNIELGKWVFINYVCSFLDLGGICIEDDVMIGLCVNIILENYLVDIVI